jgi:hypothetical protein
MNPAWLESMSVPLEYRSERSPRGYSAAMVEQTSPSKPDNQDPPWPSLHPNDDYDGAHANHPDEDDKSDSDKAEPASQD